MSQKILIQTKSRMFFLNRKDLSQIIEFAKTFSVKVDLVEVKSAQIISLADLVEQFCNQNASSTESPTFEIIQSLYPTSRQTGRTRQQMLNDAAEIQVFVIKKLRSSGRISLSEVRSKFDHLKLTDACLSRHLHKVKKSMEDSGFKFETEKRGYYKISNFCRPKRKA